MKNLRVYYTMNKVDDEQFSPMIYLPWHFSSPVEGFILVFFFSLRLAEERENFKSTLKLFDNISQDFFSFFLGLTHALWWRNLPSVCVCVWANNAACSTKKGLKLVKLA